MSSWQRDLEVEVLGSEGLEKQILGDGEKVWAGKILKN